MKTLLFDGIRALHLRTALKPMAQRLAIYMHDLEECHWPAFEEAIRRLQQEGFQSVDPSTFLNDRIGDRLLFVSFDDCFASWHRALPLMARLNVKATFYINTLPFTPNFAATSDSYFDRLAHTGERAALTRTMLQDLYSAGHTIGCHSHSHYPLTSLPPSSWDFEIRKSKDMLEDIISEPVIHFSYPYGMRRYFSDDLETYCRGIGFQTIVTGIPGFQIEAPADPFALHRTRWLLDRSLEHNLEDLRIDGRFFEKWTGRSALG